MKLLNLQLSNKKKYKLDFIEKKKKLKSGFLLKKDFYTNNLLQVHRKINSTDDLRFMNFINENKLNNNLFNPLNSIRIRKVIPLSYNTLNKSHKEIKKLQFPLPKINFPSFSQIDFYSNIKGKYNVKNLVDDLNVTSNRSKKIIYHYKNDNVNKNNTYDINDIQRNTNIKKNIFRLGLKKKINK